MNDPISRAAPVRSRRFHAAWLVVACALFAVCTASCKSAEQHRADADRETYELVASRRAKLGLTEASAFTIEPRPDSLRQRILHGELSATEPLSLVQCLEIAAENSREYQTRKESLYLAALDLTLERWRFAVQKGGTLAAAVSGSGTEAETVSGGSRFSLSRLLGNGALVVADIGLNFTKSLISSDGWNPISDLGASITQPLLANSRELIVQEALTQAERDLVYEVRAFERFRRTFAFDVASRYYRVLQQIDVVDNQRNNVANLAQLAERNRALVEAGRISDIEVGQALQDELRSKNDLLVADERREDLLDDFKLFLGLPMQAELKLDPAGLAELVAQNPDELQFDDEFAALVALAERLDHRTTLEQEEDARRAVIIARDALQASLNLIANVRATSEEGQPFSYNFQDTTWSAGLEYTFPFEKLPERNAWIRALIALQAAERESARSEDQLRADLRSSLRLHHTRRESYLIQLNAVELAEQRIESTRLKLDAGRADTRDLLEAEESLLQTRNAATNAFIDYTLARMSVLLDMELLRIDERGISFEQPTLEPAAPAAGADQPPLGT